MHEIGIMEDTLKLALEYAKRENATKITRLKMRVGDMSSVIPDSLQFAFDVMIKGTIAEGATLEIETIPVTCYCSNCQKEFTPKTLFYECPECHQLTTKILTGKELELTSLEVS
jgi:hydrogenase nickel incorporation protein HypA/HybF